MTKTAAREQQRASQILFHHRPENEAENERRCLASKLDKEVAEKPEDNRHPDIEDVVIDRIRADHAERDDRGEEPAVRHLEEPHPDIDHRKIQDDQHQVADPHGDNEPPEEARV